MHIAYFESLNVTIPNWKESGKVSSNYFWVQFLLQFLRIGLRSVVI